MIVKRTTLPAAAVQARPLRTGITSECSSVRPPTSRPIGPYNPGSAANGLPERATYVGSSLIAHESIAGSSNWGVWLGQTSGVIREHWPRRECSCQALSIPLVSLSLRDSDSAGVGLVVGGFSTSWVSLGGRRGVLVCGGRAG